MKLYHSCRRVNELLSRRLDEPLGKAEQLQLRLHLLVCRGCRHVDEQFAKLRELSAGFNSEFFGGD